MDTAEQLRRMRAERAPDEVALESVLTTVELTRRASRTPDYQAENRALLTLAQTLAHAPQTLLQMLCELTLPLCRAQSAGISILEEEQGEPLFRWRALAGEMVPYLYGITPPDFAPCGTTIERDTVQLLRSRGATIPMRRRSIRRSPNCSWRLFIWTTSRSVRSGWCAPWDMRSSMRRMRAC